MEAKTTALKGLMCSKKAKIEGEPLLRSFNVPEEFIFMA